MPSGRVHSAATTAILMTTGLCATGLISTNEDYFLLASGMTIGYFLGPDLDVNKGNISNRYIREIPYIGWLLQKLWYLFWLPYAMIIPHRHWLSHVPVISTAFRILYVYCGTYPLHFKWLVIYPRQATILIVGLTIVDTAHWMMDEASKSDIAKAHEVE